jgi:carbon storage regulator
LVLQRKCNEQIVLPQHQIVFTILDVRGDRVRIGISAPPDVVVHRLEVWQRIQAGNGAAALSK